ncbi:fatty acid amide hydrolase-like isoform X1 [Cygnus olor]|uniref:fatty acid amide hydrolase-like isoform X1 n=1 Tax=Cygnus olor TaxID=8869 RepID=UPI001ADDED46|nr:fatty acid amide hydrolase-like isoform X1 [Cygnus olor]
MALLPLLLLPLTVLPAAVYLCCVRRHTGIAAAVVQRREPGRPAARSPPRDTWAPRLCGFWLRLFSHAVNTAFGQFLLLPLLLRMHNLSLMRSLDICEDPTFIPEVAAEGTEDKSEAKSTLDIMKQLIDARTDSASKGFSFKGIKDYLDCYRSGKLTPSQVAKNIIATLEDCDKSTPPLRAIVQWDREQIMLMAEASTARHRNKCTLSHLDGIPVCLKEEFKVVPYHHRVGTVFLGTEPETEDATVAKKLREAGAVIIGVSNMHELGTGTTGCNPNRYHKIPRNPYKPNHFTGGSSSGSAAAVAAGLCPVGIGTDGGGSVRIPASFCGVVGLKGTFGRISCHGSYPLSYSTVSVGPICTSVADAAIVYSILAEPDPLYPYGLKQPKATLSDMCAPDLKGLKLGVDWTFFKACDAEVLTICEKAVEYLQSLGASVVEVSLPEMEEVKIAHVICILSEMRDMLQPDFNKHFQEMNLETRATLALASQFTALDYITANRQRTRSMRFLREIFTTVNCIVTPAVASTAPRIHESDLLTGSNDTSFIVQSMRFMQLANLTGIPGLVVPVGYSTAGLPISLQVMGKWWDEAVLLRIGLKLEQFRNQTKKPSIYYDILA